MSYLVAPDEALSQGDIIRRVVVSRKLPDDEATTNTAPSRVIVLSHGCEIDKPIKPGTLTDTVLVARVFRKADSPQGTWGNVTRRRVPNTFYLPIGPGQEEEAYVDWRSIQPVDKTVILAARHAGSYVCTLEGDLLEAMKDGLWGFLFREEPSPTS